MNIPIAISMNTLILWSLYRRHKQRDSISFIGHCHHVSILCLPDVATHDQISQAFPSIYAYCKQSKTEGGISLAMRPVSIHKAASTLLVVQDAGTGRCETYDRISPPMYLPSIYLESPHITKSPRHSPSVFAYRGFQVGVPANTAAVVNHSCMSNSNTEWACTCHYLIMCAWVISTTAVLVGLPQPTCKPLYYKWSKTRRGNGLWTKV